MIDNLRAVVSTLFLPVSYTGSYTRFILPLLSLFVLFLLNGCAFQEESSYITVPTAPTASYLIIEPKTREQDISNSVYPPITVFIHGTRSASVAAKLLLSQNLYQWVHPLLTQTIGLKPCAGDEQVFFSFAQSLQEADPVNTVPEGCFSYDWSGALEWHARQEAADRLYIELLSLQKSEQFAQSPITLIGHSHGGNVALHLAASAEKYCSKTNRVSPLVIDRLILLAAPVQDSNQTYIRSPLFKNVYHFFSGKDLAQICDPQSFWLCEQITCPTQSVLSGREFNPVDKLLQARITLNGRSPGHMSFTDPSFSKILPTLLQLLDDQELRQKLPKTSTGRSFIINIATKQRYKRLKQPIIYLKN